MRFHLLVAALVSAELATAAVDQSIVVNTTCNGKSYIYKSLVGYGYIPFDARDSRRDTIGGIGSSIAIDKKSWKKKGNKYSAYLYGLPDRGFNVNGTINYDARIQKFKMTFESSKTTGSPSKGNIQFQYVESIFLKDPTGMPMTGLDGDIVAGNHATFFGVDVPVAHYTGNGFGGAGPGGVRTPLDAEALVLADDGSFWISDEYGPFMYKFNSRGTLTQVIRPPDAFIPLRNGSQSFSADSPPIYNPNAHPVPANPSQGRQNNQGFEGLTISPDGKKLYTLIQSALRQDGGDGATSNRFYARFLIYDITQTPAKATAEYVVRLPVDSLNRTAAQSEIHYISDTQFFVLARDSARGAGQTNSTSLYRQTDIFDISKATNILGLYDGFNQSIVTNVTTATLRSSITTAQYCSFINYNNNSQLSKFGLRNGGDLTAPGLLNEKWEGLALLPVNPNSHKKSKRGSKSSTEDYFLFTMSDNDFRAIDVYSNNGSLLLHDTVNLDNQFMAFRLSLPTGTNPLLG